MNEYIRLTFPSTFLLHNNALPKEPSPTTLATSYLLCSMLHTLMCYAYLFIYVNQLFWKILATFKNSGPSSTIRITIDDYRRYLFPRENIIIRSIFILLFTNYSYCNEYFFCVIETELKLFKTKKKNTSLNTFLTVILQN